MAPHFRAIGIISTANLKMNAGWGRKDKRGKIFPGKGKCEIRDWTNKEKSVLEDGFSTISISAARGHELLGRAVDVYLNDSNYWCAVPENVWNFHIGGYQVIKKWLSSREEAVLGRPLNKDEAREVTSMVRRLTAIVLMTDELDNNYIAARDNAYPWPS